MDYDRWIDDAWNRHPDDPAGVLADIATTGAALAADDAAVDGLLRLAHHVAGAHLGRPEQLAEGRALLARLAGHAAAGEAARASAALFDRSLALTGAQVQDQAQATIGLAEPEAVRVRALAASNLADREATRAGRLLGEAATAARAADLPDTHPAVRALAVAGNNIAAALEELPTRDAATQALMLQAAELGLVFWRRAGTWLHEERAQHRLAMCALAAGDLPKARGHAQACLAIVEAHDRVALEAFFGWQALGLVEAAAAAPDAYADALSQAEAAFARLTPDDQTWCGVSLDKLRSALP